MSALAHQPSASAHARRRRPAGHNPLLAPLMLFAAVVVMAASYVGYVLWPRWPDAPVARDAPSVPIVIAGITFNIEPAAIRMAVQRRPGTHERVDLAYLWPALVPPDPALKTIDGKPVDPNRRLFVTIETTDGTLPIIERVETIYARYLVRVPKAGPQGLTLRGFRDDSPYRGEEIAFESRSPAHFLARCSRKGVMNSGTCLLERRIGEADITVRFPRDWLADWKSVAAGIDRLMARLHRN